VAEMSSPGARAPRRGAGAKLGDRPEKRGDRRGGQAGDGPLIATEPDRVAAVASVQDNIAAAGFNAAAILADIARNPDTNAAARASAARALAEIEGTLGRHAQAPVRDTADVAQLSRADLVRELERLRAACQAGPRP